MITVDVKKELDQMADRNAAEARELESYVQTLLEDVSEKEKYYADLLDIRGLDEPEENLKVELYKKFGDFVTKQNLEELGVKYNLRCLKRTYFKGNIPKEAIPYVTRFGEEIEATGKKFYRGNVYILAPAESFKLKKIEKDPILLYKIEDGYFKVIYKWGNDMTIGRRIQAFLMRNNVLSIAMFWVAILLAIIANAIIPVYNLDEINTWYGGTIAAISGIIGLMSVLVLVDYHDTISPLMLNKERVFSKNKIWDFSKFKEFAEILSVLFIIGLVLSELVVVLGRGGFDYISLAVTIGIIAMLYGIAYLLKDD